MSDRDEIKDLFSKKLGEHQVQVRPELWNGIQSQIGGIGSSVSTSSSIFSKSLLIKGFTGIALIAGIGTASYLMMNRDESKKVEIPTVQSQKALLPSENKVEETAGSIQNDAIEIHQEENNLTPYSSDTIKHYIHTEENNHIVSPEQHTSEKQESIIPKTDNSNQKSNQKDVRQEDNKKQEKDLIVEDSKKNNTTSIPKPQTENEVKQGIVKQWANTNIFTPNGDGVNDYFFLETKNLTEFSISILNQNNQVVYSTEDANFHWDGRNMNGEIVPDGSYFYIVVAKGLDGQYVKQYQTLQIAR